MLGKSRCVAGGRRGDEPAKPSGQSSPRSTTTLVYAALRETPVAFATSLAIRLAGPPAAARAWVAASIAMESASAGASGAPSDLTPNSGPFFLRILPVLTRTLPHPATVSAIGSSGGNQA